MPGDRASHLELAKVQKEELAVPAKTLAALGSIVGKVLAGHVLIHPPAAENEEAVVTQHGGVLVAPGRRLPEDTNAGSRQHGSRHGLLLCLTDGQPLAQGNIKDLQLVDMFLLVHASKDYQKPLLVHLGCCARPPGWYKGLCATDRYHTPGPLLSVKRPYIRSSIAVALYKWLYYMPGPGKRGGEGNGRAGKVEESGKNKNQG